MKRSLLIGTVLILVHGQGSCALAQQPQSPSQVARQMVNVINSWADALEAMQQQIATLTKERDELKAKLEAKEKENAKQ